MNENWNFAWAFPAFWAACYVMCLALFALAGERDYGRLCARMATGWTAITAVVIGFGAAMLAWGPA